MGPRDKDDDDNHSNQLNPNNDAYWESRGYVDLLRKSGEFFVMKEDLYDQAEAANEGI